MSAARGLEIAKRRTSHRAANQLASSMSGVPQGVAVSIPSFGSSHSTRIVPSTKPSAKIIAQ